jgi:hypothetical protein
MTIIALIYQSAVEQKSIFWPGHLDQVW